MGHVPVLAPHFNENVYFNENPTQRDVPIVNPWPGAIPIQDQLERINWLGNGGGGRFARHLRLAPLTGSARPFLVQESRGDQNIPNQNTAEFVQAGLLADRVTLYRHDLFASRLAFTNPHSFLIRTDNVAPAMRPVSLAAQEQVAAFFESDGVNVIDPDGSRPLFEKDLTAASIPHDFGFILVNGER